MQILTGLKEKPASLVFSPDGRYLAAGEFNAFRLWDLAAGAGPLWSHDDSCLGRSFAFTTNGASLVGGWLSTFARYAVRTGEKTADPFLSVFLPDWFSPDGRFILAAARNDEAGVLQLRCARATNEGWTESWRKEWLFDPARSPPLFVQFSSDGSRLVRAYWRGAGVPSVPPFAVDVLDSATGDRVTEWAGKLRPAASPGSVSSTGALVLLSNQSFFAVDTTRPRSKPIKRLNLTPKHFTSAAFSPNGARLATTSNDTAATIWDTTAWEPRKRYEWNIGRLRTVCFAPDGLRCAAAGDAGQVVVWDLDD